MVKLFLIFFKLFENIIIFIRENTFISIEIDGFLSLRINLILIIFR
jgi:hypothetical protein